jgi:diaminopimelate decarboxylase
MDHFEYRQDELWCDGVRAGEMADRFGTPLYVYAQATLRDHFHRLREAFAPLDPLICYSIKSCQNVHICRQLLAMGSGFDVVSGGELHRALVAGADPKQIVFAGVGKTDAEIDAGLKAGIGYFNVESESEMGVIAERARAAGSSASVALRVNPDVDARTHAYTTTGKKETKFGVYFQQAHDCFREFRNHPGLRLRGIHLHIGSPVYDVTAYQDAIRVGIELIDKLRADGFPIDTIDIGGGYGAHYAGSESPPLSEYGNAIVPLLKEKDLRVIIEPGRSIAGNAGILLTRVLHHKRSGEKEFLIVDASMNELLRPALYDAYHFIWPVKTGGLNPASRAAKQPFDQLRVVDVVGPVCETSDFLAKGRSLPAMQRGDLIAVFTCGAYAMTMASQYNSRPRPAEVLVTGDSVELIRRRETYDDLLAAEMQL